ncbi:hypothetical protein JCM24511_01090 [Saitozyma sp. JCM 24511]|nr:hypothetical protein JCM24511_01090 [Saitozyma sp. JCM 24511]
MDAFRQMTGPIFPSVKPPSVSPSSQHQPSPHNSTGSATHPSPYARSYPPASTLDRLLGNTGTGAPSDFTFGGADRLDFGYGSTSTSTSGAGVGGGGGGGRKDAMQRSYGSLSEDRRDEDRFGTNNGFGDFQRGQNQSTTPSTGTGAGAGAGAAQAFPTAGPTAKRGSKACVACRKGKNRCEGDPTGQNKSCRRCLVNGITCVFEKPAERQGRNRQNSVGTADGHSGDAEGRVATLERSVHDLAQGQSQIQQAILSILPQGGAASVPPYISDGTGAVSTANIFQNSVSPPLFTATTGQEGYNRPRSPQNIASGRLKGNGEVKKPAKDFPKLPGFAPPDHRFGTYGIIPLPSAPPSPTHSRHSSRSSSSHSVASSSALPQDSLTAPIQALQALANAADQAAAIAESGGDMSRDEQSSRRASGDEDKEGDGEEGERGRSRKRKRVQIDSRNIHLRVKKKTKPDPTPRNPFPDVITKGLVSETEARELWDIFFSGCHYFVPLWDKSYDTYETYVERTPFSTNGLLAVAAKIRAGNGPLGPTFHRCLEEAQGIARSTLFGPIVRKEAVMAMLILSVWSQNGWLPCGHALRMGLDMNLHRALDKLADGNEHRSDAEERDLVVSARIWLNCYMHDHLSHPMVSETDMRLIAGVELVNLRIRVAEHLNPLHGKVDSQTISFVKRAFADLQDWYREWHGIHRQRYDEESVLVRLLEAELVYAQLWTVCVALRGCQWNKLPPDQRELAFQAKDAAMRCLEIFLKSANFRAHLKCVQADNAPDATHDQLVSVAFAAVFLLKIAILYPSAISLPDLISQVNELAHVLSAECFAERYALTLRLMLSNFRRKTGALSTVPGTPRMAQATPGFTLPTLGPGQVGDTAVGDLDGGLASFLNLPNMGGAFDTTATGTGTGGFGAIDWGMGGDGLEGFAWPNEFSPSNLPVWLQDGNMADLGLPADGSDSLFLPLELANMFLPSGTTSSANYQFSLPDSGDFGAEAW